MKRQRQEGNAEITDLLDEVITDSDTSLAAKLVARDFSSLHMQHMHMWDMFDSVLKLLITVEGFPLLGSGVLISAKAIHVESLTQLKDLPSIVSIMALGSGILGMLVMMVLIHYRLDILMYARTINSIRNVYTKILPRFAPDIIPISSDIPKYWEPLREVGILVLAFSCIHAFYLTISLLNIFSDFAQSLPWNQTVTGFGMAIILVVAQYTIYFLLTRRNPIAGQHGHRVLQSLQSKTNSSL